MMVHEDKCAEYGLDAQKVASIARRLSRAARDAEVMSLTIFGGSGHGTLRFTRAECGGNQTSVADLDGCFDGGDGGDNW